MEAGAPRPEPRDPPAPATPVAPPEPDAAQRAAPCGPTCDAQDGMPPTPDGTTAGLFESAVRLHSRRLLAIARAVVGTRASAEDVVQQALVNLYQHRERYDWREPSLAGGLMRRAVVNEALRILRQPRMRAVVDDHPDDRGRRGRDASPADPVIDRETVQRVRQAIARLPEHFRAALVLCEYENMAYAQIAEVLGASVPRSRPGSTAAAGNWPRCSRDSWRRSGARESEAPEGAGRTTVPPVRPGTSGSPGSHRHEAKRRRKTRKTTGTNAPAGARRSDVEPTPYYDDDTIPSPDPDFALLESYLDGELSPGEIADLDRRLRGEPELAGALGRMSAEYAVRRAVWASLEPGKSEATRVARGAGISARQLDRRRQLGKLSRLAGAAAACIAVGFLAGWVGRGNTAARADTGRQVATTGGAASAPAPQTPAEPYVYQVALTDEAGNITAVQKFDNLEDARNFAADVGRWQARQQQVEQGQTVMTSSGL